MNKHGLYDYYDKVRERNIRHKMTLKVLKERGRKAEEWFKIHPEGITKKNLKEFQKFVTDKS